MLITPLPPTVCIMSSRFSIGSPKNLSPPWLSSVSRPRWMAPTLAALTLPYCVVNCLAFSPTKLSMLRRSFRSSSSSPLSSAILNTRLSTPVCVSFKSSMRDSSSGPMSLMVARTGWPCSPNTSHRVTGQLVGSGRGRPRSFRMSAILPPMVPCWLMPVRSPFTSLMNTGTPMALKDSASFCSVTVLPVPVAPVISPWRLAKPGRMKVSISPCLAMRMGSAMGGAWRARKVEWTDYPDT